MSAQKQSLIDDLIASFIIPDHPLKKEIFDEINQWDDDKIIEEINKVLEKPADTTIRKRLRLYGKWTVRELLLLPTTGDEDIYQALATNIDSVSTAEKIEETLSHPFPDREELVRLTIRQYYLLIKAIEIESRRPDLFHPEDSSENSAFFKYLLSDHVLFSKGRWPKWSLDCVRNLLSSSEFLIWQLFGADVIGHEDEVTVDRLVEVLSGEDEKEDLESIKSFLALLDKLQKDSPGWDRGRRRLKDSNNKRDSAKRYERYINKLQTAVARLNESGNDQLTRSLANPAMNSMPFEDIFLKTFDTPFQLSDEEVKLYLKGDTEGKKFYVRRLDPAKDMHFIEQWKINLAKDVAWQAEWAKKDFYADRLPRFGYISESSLGLFSQTAGESRLEGFIGLDSQASSYDAHHRNFLYNIGILQMEVYYRNIGSKGDIKGVADLLFDILIKFCANPQNYSNQGISFYPVTPGSEAFGRRRGLIDRDGHYLLTAEKLQLEFANRHLGNLFNSDPAMNSWPLNNKSLKGAIAKIVRKIVRPKHSMAKDERVPIIQSTWAGRNSESVQDITSYMFRWKTGIDLSNQKPAVVFDIGVLSASSMGNFPSKLKSLNPNIRLIATEVNVPKAYIRSSLFENIVSGFEMRGVLAVNPDFTITSAYREYRHGFEDPTREDDIFEEMGGTFYLSGEFWRSKDRDMVTPMKQALAAKGIDLSPGALQRMIEGGFKYDSDEFSLQVDPLKNGLEAMGVDLQVSSMPDLIGIRSDTPAILLFSNVLGHYPAEKRQSYWNELTNELRKKDVVVVKEMAGTGFSKLVVYQKQGKKLVELYRVDYAQLGNQSSVNPAMKATLNLHDYQVDIKAAETSGGITYAGSPVEDQFSHIKVKLGKPLISQYNTRSLSQEGRIILSALVKQSGNKSLAVLEAGPGTGRASWDMKNMGDKINVDTVSLTPVAPHILLKMDVRGILDLIIQRILGGGDYPNISSYMDAWMKDQEAVIVKFGERSFGKLSNAEKIEVIKMRSKMLSVSIPTDLVFQLEQYGFSIFEKMAKPYIRHQYIGDFTDQSIVLPEKGYDFIYDYFGALHYSAQIFEGNAVNPLEKAARALNSTGILFFADASEAKVLFKESHSLGDFVGIILNREMLIIRKDSVIFQKVKKYLTPMDVNIFYGPENIEVLAEAISGDRAQISEEKGGIDFTSGKVPLEMQNADEGIKFHFDSAQLAQLQNAPGFVPVIINIQPLIDLRRFLGVEAPA